MKCNVPSVFRLHFWRRLQFRFTLDMQNTWNWKFYGKRTRKGTNSEKHVSESAVTMPPSPIAAWLDASGLVPPQPPYRLWQEHRSWCLQPRVGSPSTNPEIGLQVFGAMQALSVSSPHAFHLKFEKRVALSRQDKKEILSVLSCISDQ